MYLLFHAWVPFHNRQNKDVLLIIMNINISPLKVDKFDFVAIYFVAFKNDITEPWRKFKCSTCGTSVKLFLSFVTLAFQPIQISRYILLP